MLGRVEEKHLEVEYTFLDEVSSDKTLLTASREEVDELIANINLPSGIALEVVHDARNLSDFKFLLLAAIVIFSLF